MGKILRDIEDDTPMFHHFGNIKFIDFVVYCLNVAIGSGALKLGFAFRAGLLFSLIVSIAVAILSFYSLELYVLSASRYHASTFEEIWKSAFSEWSSITLAIFSIIFAIINLMGYYQFLQGSVITIVSLIIELFEDSSHKIEEVEKYQFVIGILITLVFSIPFCISSSAHTTITISYISMASFTLLLIYIIIRFIIDACKNGFDPSNEFKLFDVSDHCVGCLSSFILAYLIYPLEYPSLKYSKNGSKRGLSLIFLTLIISCFILYSLMGIFSYFSFFSKNTGGSIMTYYPEETTTDRILLIVGHLLSFIMVIFTMLVRINVCRYSLIQIFEKRENIPQETWVLFGITFSLIGCALSNLPNEITDIIGKLSDIIAALFMFFIPPIMFIRGYGKSRPFYLFIAIFELLVGIAAIVFYIYFDFIHS